MAQPVVASEPNELWERNAVRTERFGAERVGKERVRTKGVGTGKPHRTSRRYCRV